LDPRHARVKRQIRFPREWDMPPEKVGLLDQKRAEAGLLEEGRVLVSGVEAIERARVTERAVIREPVMAALGAGRAPKRVR